MNSWCFRAGYEVTCSALWPARWPCTPARSARFLAPANSAGSDYGSGVVPGHCSRSRRILTSCSRRPEGDRCAGQVLRVTRGIDRCDPGVQSAPPGGPDSQRPVPVRHQHIKRTCQQKRTKISGPDPPRGHVSAMSRRYAAPRHRRLGLKVLMCSTTCSFPTRAKTSPISSDRWLKGRSVAEQSC
jgi:hypothetical protein